MSHATSRLILLALAAICGCDTTEPDLFSYWSRIEGVVSAPNAVPVADAEIQFRAMYRTSDPASTSCEDYLFENEVDLAVTSSMGSYSKLIQGLNVALPDCVEVRVIPPGTSSLKSAIDTVSLEWSLDQGTAPVTRLDVALSN